MEDMHGKGALAETVTYNVVISACANSEQWQKALQLMEDMQGKGVPADIITYTASCESACENGR